MTKRQVISQCWLPKRKGEQEIGITMAHWSDDTIVVWTTNRSRGEHSSGFYCSGTDRFGKASKEFLKRINAHFESISYVAFEIDL